MSDKLVKLNACEYSQSLRSQLFQKEIESKSN